MNNLKINRNFFSFGGVVGRLRFIFNLLLSLFLLFGFGFSWVICLIQHFRLLGTVNLIILLTLLAFYYSNFFKRMRDVRGTLEYDLLLRIIVFLFLSIPSSNIVIMVALSVLPGKITRKSK